MELRHGLVTVNSTTPTQLIIDDTDTVHYFGSLSIQNVDEEATVYLGDSTVTTSDYGYRLLPGNAFFVERVPRYHGLYAVSSAASSQVAVLRVSL